MSSHRDVISHTQTPAGLGAQCHSAAAFTRVALEIALKKAKRSGDPIQRELRQREGYVKPSVKRRQKSLRARTRLRKAMNRAGRVEALRARRFSNGRR